MFYDNEEINRQAVLLLIKHPENYELITAINDTYRNIDTFELKDKNIRRTVSLIQVLSKNIKENMITDKSIAKMLFMNFDKVTKKFKESVISSYNDNITTDMQKMFQTYFVSQKYAKNAETIVSEFNDSLENFITTPILVANEKRDGLKEKFLEIKDMMNNVLEETQSRQHVIIDSRDRNNVKFTGLSNIIEDINNETHLTLKTGIDVIDMAYGGFKPAKFYIAASIPGGFKSGVMINIAEGLAINNPIAKNSGVIEDGMIPAILYVTLEESLLQIMKRRLAFHDININDIVNKEMSVSDQVTSLTEAISNIYPEETETHIYPQVVTRVGKLSRYGTEDLRQDIQFYKESGYQVIMAITDYMGIFKYEPLESDVKDKAVLPLERTAYRHKAVASDLKIPVFSATQLNRSGETDLKEAMARYLGDDDFIKVLNAGSLAGAHAIKRVPEVLSYVYKYDVGPKSYFSILVDKDRDNTATNKNKSSGVDIVSETDSNNERINKLNSNGAPSYDKSCGAYRDSRMHYVAEMRGFRIGNNYAPSIKDFQNNETKAITSIFSKKVDTFNQTGVR